MRSRLAARSTRLVLAAAAVTALAATTTACGPEEDGAAAGATSSATESATAGSAGESSTGGSDSGSDSASDAGSGSKDSGSEDSGSTGSAAGSGGSGKDGYGQSCGTNDLNFKVTSETQAGGYYLVTVSAKSGITCYLDPNTPSVSFGSKREGVASPVGQGGEDAIKLTGSTVAYAGISPKTTKGDAGVEFEEVIVATSEDDENPVSLKLPEAAVVEKPIVTNWDDEIAGAVPQIV
ncbi:hypothetical protein ACFXP3_36320 [Streptomyces sp. NPDC059096]|uniref:hypothetical protein n=1 Tax=Streptomyces sp. NPDC059096 TaxID=3346727 RepID=UPI0036CCE674